MDSTEDNYDKAMELLEHAKREADMATERNNQTAAFQQRIAELEQEKRRLRKLLDSANLIIRQTCEARDAAMRPADQIRYLGRGSDWILTDLFRRVHKAEDRLAVSSERQGTDDPHTN